MCMPRSIRTAAVYLAAAVLFMLLAVSGAQACPVTVTPPAGATLERSVFAVTEFANLTYHDSFSGQVGQTATWPGEMGWQGDRIDVGFIVPELPAGEAEPLHYRLSIQITQQFAQEFHLAVLVGADAADLEEVHREFIDSPRTYVALIPACQLTPGGQNLIRLQGVGVSVGFGEAPGVLWSNWSLAAVHEADLDAVRADQLQRLTTYITDAITPSGLVRDTLPLSPDVAATPATPDAAGFALLGLAAADHLGLIADAPDRVRSILRAYAGYAPGVTPQRSADGFWIHYMDPATGRHPGGGYDSAYTPIGAALLVTGARFAANHFIDDAEINELAAELEATVDFDAAIHPSLDGRIFLSMAPGGGGDTNFGVTRPWNEYMLVVSAALRQPGPAPRAQAVRHLWMNPANLPRASHNGISTLTDVPGVFAPAFWVHQSHYFNADFSTDAALTPFFTNHRVADRVYCLDALSEPFRYGLTAGPTPGGYGVERIGNNNRVFSPEAVAAWGDMDTLLKFYAAQPIAPSDPRARYGMVRVSAIDPGWIPPDAPLVDHLFLMFGLVESLDPVFFKQRQPGQIDADADGIADAFDNCPGLYNPAQSDADADGTGDACDCTPDLTNDGTVDVFDLLAYLDLWFAADPAADLVNGGGATVVDVFDLLAYLDSWFAPPAAC